MINLVTPKEYEYDIECIVRIFFPGIKMLITQQPSSGYDDVITAQITNQGFDSYALVSVLLGGNSKQSSQKLEKEATKGEIIRALSRLLFLILKEYTGIAPSWGILTGVRPVRLYRGLLNKGLTPLGAIDYLQSQFLVKEAKTKLVDAVFKEQSPILSINKPDHFSLYVSIPFCPSRCLYCSFVSHAIDKAAKLIPIYLTKLVEEIEETGRLVKNRGLILDTIYIGGGTPSILSANEFEVLLSAIEKSFGRDNLLEYTVEAGRPDTITKEKLKVLKRYGVGRISINPQVMDDEVLRENNRNHTVEDFLEGYKIVREAGFDSVNMDLILGLKGGKEDRFIHSLEEVIKLSPENITVHTLTVKRSSSLRKQEDAFEIPQNSLAPSLDMGVELLYNAGYKPYYLYRQKSGIENLENIGYTKNNHAGIYNVFSMEDVHTILAVGAGGVSKFCHPNGRIDRVFNHKYPYEYIERFNEVLERKAELVEG